MKLRLTLAVAAVFMAFTAIAQTPCPTCTIDASCSNANEVALCPPTLAPACKDSFYSEALTFYVPRNVNQSGTNATLSAIEVISVTNIPSGMTYSLDEPSGVYTITGTERRGCVTICGTPKQLGTFNVTVTVRAFVTSPINTQQVQSFSLPISIAACGTNPFFSYQFKQGCDTVCNNFQALIEALPPQITEYEWDFGNGQTTTGKNPPSVCYNTPGAYRVKLDNVYYSLVLDSIHAEEVSDWWCGDIEETKIGGVCQGDPDMVFTFSSGTASLVSNEKSNQKKPKWSKTEILNRFGGQPFRLRSNAVSISFIDVDAISANDNGGIWSGIITTPGTYNFTTVIPGTNPPKNGVTGTLFICKVLDSIQTQLDTIELFALPPASVITSTQDTSFCSNDSAVLTIPNGPYRFAWIKNDTSIIALEETNRYVIEANPFIPADTVIVIKASYTDTITGCTFVTPNYVTRMRPGVSTGVQSSGIFPAPGQANTLTALSGNYTYQWLFNGLPIAGATSQTYSPLVDGNYSIIYTNQYGCSLTSNQLAFVFNSVRDINIDNSLLSVFPNPANSTLNLTYHTLPTESATLNIINVLGAVVRSVELGSLHNTYITQLDVSNLLSGNYIVEIKTQNTVSRQRVSIQR
jgi:hypothetical protein